MLGSWGPSLAAPLTVQSSCVYFMGSTQARCRVGRCLIHPPTTETPVSPPISENHSWQWGQAEVMFSSATKQSVMMAGPSAGPCSVALTVFQLAHVPIVNINSLLSHTRGSGICISTSTDLSAGFVSTRYT